MYSSCLWLSLVTLPDRLEGSWTGNRQQALSYGVLDPQHQRNPLKTRGPCYEADVLYHSAAPAMTGSEGCFLFV